MRKKFKLHWVVWLCVAMCFALLPGCSGSDSSNDDSLVVITTQPADQSVVVGNAASFSVVASNAIGYQWEKSTDDGATFVAISGAIASDYTTPATILADSGLRFRVVVTGKNNEVTSSAAALTVSPAPIAPAISTQPADQSVAEGADASFTVTATGTDLSYQWQRSTDGGSNYADVTGANGVTMTLTGVALGANGHLFRVQVSNTAGNVTSSSAVLTVSVVPAAPQFTSQPADTSVIAPNTASFSVSVTGTPSPTLQWQKTTDSGTTWDNISGATGSSYTISATSGSDNGSQYRAVATNSAGTATSSAATLTVALPEAPAFTTQPVNSNVSAGQSAQFSVAVSGVPTPTLQWQKSTDSGTTWNNINGATSTTYSFTTTAGDSGSQYRAVATNTAGITNSDAATLTVTTNYAWGPAPNLRFVDVRTTTEYAQYVDFAMNANGDAIAIWLQNDGIRSNLWANRFTASTKTWGTPELIETLNEGIYSDINPLEGPRIAMNDDGSAVAVWVYTSLSYQVWVNNFTVTQGWGTARAIDTPEVGRSYVPRVAIDGSGKALAVWHRRDGEILPPRWSAWGNSMAADGSWAGAVRLENDDTRSAFYPTVAMNAAGKAAVVWNWATVHPSTYDPIYSDIAAVYYDGGWGAAVDISSGAGTLGTSAKPEVGMDASGNAIAVWRQNDSGTQNIHASRRTGSWAASTVIDNLSTPAFDVNLAVNASGEAIATWIQYDALSNPDIHANRFSPSVGWGTASLVESFSEQAAIMPRAAIDPDGNAMALMGRVASAQPGRLRANRAPAGGSWGTDVAVDGVSYPNAPTSWRLAMDGSGRAMALWVQEGNTGSHFRVYYNRYE